SLDMKSRCVAALLLCLFVSNQMWAQDAPSRKADMARINKAIDAEAESLLALYKQIHAFPELAFQEEQTSARLAKELRKVGFEVTEKVGANGIVGVLKNGK